MASSLLLELKGKQEALLQRLITHVFAFKVRMMDEVVFHSFDSLCISDHYPNS